MSCSSQVQDVASILRESETLVGNKTSDASKVALSGTCISDGNGQADIPSTAVDIGFALGEARERKRLNPQTYVFGFGQKPTITSTGGEGTDSSDTPPPMSSCTPPEGGEVRCGGDVSGAVTEDAIDINEMGVLPAGVGGIADQSAPKDLFDSAAGTEGCAGELFDFAGVENGAGGPTGLDLLYYESPNWNGGELFSSGVGDTLEDMTGMTGGRLHGKHEDVSILGSSASSLEGQGHGGAAQPKFKQLRQSKVVAKWWWHLGTEHWKTRVEGGVYVNGVLTAVNDGTEERGVKTEGGRRREKAKTGAGDAGEERDPEERKKPSRFCHICLRRAERVTAVACGNLPGVKCRKVVCRRCFEEYGWDWRQATARDSKWVCTHCRKECPERAQCFNYSRTNNRRHVALMRKKTQLQHKSVGEGLEAVAGVGAGTPDDDGGGAVVPGPPRFDALICKHELTDGVNEFPGLDEEFRLF